MKISEITIASITWARDVQEEKLLRESLRYLAEWNIPVVIADAGSGSGFLSYLKSFSNFTVLEFKKPNLLAQVKESLTTASSLGKRYVLYTESDKRIFFEHHLGEFIAQIPGEDRVDVTVASRTLESFSTFPEFQRYTETVANQLCEQIIGQHGDFCYGPLLMHRAIISCLDLIEGDIGWGWRFYTLGIASRLGYQVAQLTLDLPCPPEHQGEDDKSVRIYRMHQLVQNVQGLLVSQSIPHTKLKTLYTS